jgi:hypothetical protein
MKAQAKDKPAAQASREVLHALVDEVPEDKLLTATRFLRFLRDVGRDPVGWAFDHAPEDDEQETPEEAEAVAESRAQAARGEVVTAREARRILGL